MNPTNIGTPVDVTGLSYDWFLGDQLFWRWHLVFCFAAQINTCSYSGGVMTLRFVLSMLLTTIVAASSGFAGTIEENRELVSKFIAAENAKDYENLPTYVTKDFKRHSQATPNAAVANRDQFVAHMRDDDEFFGDVKYYAQQVIAEGDRVAVWASYQGRATGVGAVAPKIDVDVSMIFRVEGNKIAELWTMWDNNALRSQLDVSSN